MKAKVYKYKQEPERNYQSESEIRQQITNEMYLRVRALLCAVHVGLLRIESAISC